MRVFDFLHHVFHALFNLGADFPGCVVDCLAKTSLLRRARLDLRNGHDHNQQTGQKVPHLSAMFVSFLIHTCSFCR